MRILIDGGSLQESGPDPEKANIITGCLNLVTKKHPEADWLLLGDGLRSQDHLAALEMEKKIVKGWVGGRLGRKLWDSRRLASVTKQWKAGLLMTVNGIKVSGGNIPQCNWVTGKIASGRKKQGNLPGAFFTWSEKEKQELIGLTGCPPESVFVVYGGPGEDFRPLSWVEKESEKVRYAGGREYFLAFFTGLRQEELINLLKAFSLFKKRQQSNMQMVLTGLGNPGIDFTEKLENYKYRSDVHFIRQRLTGKEEAMLVAGSYAVIPYFAGSATGLLVSSAFRAEVPVILPAGGCAAEIAEDAALYAGPGDAVSLADRLMAIYKDEQLRNTLIVRGSGRLAGFDWEDAVQKVWEGILYSVRD